MTTPEVGWSLRRESRAGSSPALLDSLRPAVLSSPWATRALWLIAGATLLRLVVIAVSGLSDTESYYAVWSRFPALSYYDHPPLVAWMTWLTTLGWRVHTPFAVRVGAVACAALFDVLLYRFAARLFSPRAGFFAVAVVTILPAFLFTGFLLNPEGPLAPLWMLCLMLIDDLRRRDEPWRPVVLGLVIGVAFLAKYTAILAVPVALASVLTTSATRAWLRRPSFYLGGLVALAVASPVIAWNHAHHWPSLTLHLVERMAPLQASTLLANARRALVGQVALFHPLVFPALLAAAGFTVWRARKDERYRLLAWASGPVLLFFFAAMVKVRDAEPHWTMVGYMPAAVAAGAWIDERLDRGGRLLHAYLRGCVALTVAAAALYVAHTLTPALLAHVPASAYSPNADPLNETLGWDDLGEAIGDEAARLGPSTVVAGGHNVLCGHIDVWLNDEPAVYCPSPRRTEFDFLGRRDPPRTAPVVYVASTRYPDSPAEVLPDRRCDLARVVPVSRGGHFVNRYSVYDCPATEP